MPVSAEDRALPAGQDRALLHSGAGGMAKDQFSFDIVSEVDLQEVRNAVDQAGRELSQRFDFKDTAPAWSSRTRRSSCTRPPKTA